MDQRLLWACQKVGADVRDVLGWRIVEEGDDEEPRPHIRMVVDRGGAGCPLYKVPLAEIVPKPSPPEVNATPSAKSLAEAHGIDLFGVRGKGVEGRVLKSDVQALIGE
jgi:pyruvate/2-oxoglutarate dehydrogenase complex dihydrolipoamide acyltransferase (E2) component